MLALPARAVMPVLALSTLAILATLAVVGPFHGLIWDPLYRV